MTTTNVEETKLTLRVLKDCRSNKVVFAEDDSDFVDVLLSFMTLPLGTIVKLMDKHFGPDQVEPLGSLKTLYHGVKELDSSIFCREEAKLMLLNPRRLAEDQCWNLKLNIDDVSEPTQIFICEDWECIKKNSSEVFLSRYNVTRCKCGRLMNREIGTGIDIRKKINQNVFITEGKSFVVSDDLQITSNVADSTIQLLNSLGIKDMTDLRQTTCIVGFKEIINILGRSFVSNTPLSDVILRNKSLKSETLFSEIINRNKGTNCTKFFVKVIVSKVTQKVIFAQAEDDFIEFLLSLLTIPLGKVVSLLSDNTSLGSIGNIYKSISCLDYSYLIGRFKLLNPKCPPQPCCKKRIFDLDENFEPLFKYKCFFESQKYNFHLTSFFETEVSKTSSICFSGYTTFKDPRDSKIGYVCGPSMYIVTDNFEITPSSPISSISFLNKMGILFSDVEEQVLIIGEKEALSILRSSLRASSPVNNGLTLMLKDLLKQKK